MKKQYFKICIILISSIIIFLTGFYVNKYKIASLAKSTLKELINKNIDLPKDFANGVFSKPEKINLEFSEKNYGMLMNDRAIALNRGMLFSDHNVEVPVKIYYNNEKFKGKASLKGDWPDHFADSKISFRINIKGDEKMMGLDEFALQQPLTRSFILEWICHKLEEKENLIHLRTKYVQVTVNDKNKGIYQLEEYFDDTIFENNHLPEGVIFKIKGTEHDLKIFSEKQIYSSLKRKNHLSSLYEKYDAFIEDKLPIDEVFDIEKIAKWYAITDLVKGYHQLYNNNLHFYFNPDKQKIEPIGREWNDYFKENKEISIEMVNDSCMPNNPLNSWFHKKIFTNEVFIQEYYKALLKLSSHHYLDEFFEEISAEMQQNLNILYKDYPLYTFKKYDLYRNQEAILKKLNPERPIKAFQTIAKDGTQKLHIRSLSIFPLMLKSIECNDKDIKIHEEIILQPNRKNSKIEYKTIILPQKENKEEANVSITYVLLGAEQSSKFNVLPPVIE
jgi:hypothetical protein